MQCVSGKTSSLKYKRPQVANSVAFIKRVLESVLC